MPAIGVPFSARPMIGAAGYRMPLNGSEKPSAIGAVGQPTDQFSFREDGRARLIDVLVRSDGGGDWMWNNEHSRGDVALLSVPIGWMGDGSRTVNQSRYRRLPLRPAPLPRRTGH